MDILDDEKAYRNCCQVLFYFNVFYDIVGFDMSVWKASIKIDVKLLLWFNSIFKCGILDYDTYCDFSVIAHFNDSLILTMRIILITREILCLWM